VTRDTVVLSTIGAALRQRGIGVGELRRRLAQRGIHVSRGALDRLASDQPLKSVNFDLLLPVLEELGMTLGEPFVALPGDELERQHAARAVANETVHSLANGHPTSAAAAALVDSADLADEEMVDRLDRQLRREHPEAFDARGRLRKRALTRALATRFGGLRLTGEQVDAVIATGREVKARRRGGR
jgi:hypothetical protein